MIRRTKEQTALYLEGIAALVKIQQALGVEAVEDLIRDWRRVSTLVRVPEHGVGDGVQPLGRWAS